MCCHYTTTACSPPRLILSLSTRFIRLNWPSLCAQLRATGFSLFNHRLRHWSYPLDSHQHPPDYKSGALLLSYGSMKQHLVTWIFPSNFRALGPAPPTDPRPPLGLVPRVPLTPPFYGGVGSSLPVSSAECLAPSAPGVTGPRAARIYIELHARDRARIGGRTAGKARDPALKKPLRLNGSRDRLACWCNAQRNARRENRRRERLRLGLTIGQRRQLCV